MILLILPEKKLNHLYLFTVRLAQRCATISATVARTTAVIAAPGGP